MSLRATATCSAPPKRASSPARWAASDAVRPMRPTSTTTFAAGTNSSASVVTTSGGVSTTSTSTRSTSAVTSRTVARVRSPGVPPSGERSSNCDARHLRRCEERRRVEPVDAVEGRRQRRPLVGDDLRGERPPEVGVDEDDAATGLGERRREVDGDRRLALGRARRGDEDRADPIVVGEWLPAGGHERDRRPQRAEGLGRGVVLVRADDEPGRPLLACQRRQLGDDGRTEGVLRLAPVADLGVEPLDQQRDARRRGAPRCRRRSGTRLARVRGGVNPPVCTWTGCARSSVVRLRAPAPSATSER